MGLFALPVRPSWNWAFLWLHLLWISPITVKTGIHSYQKVHALISPIYVIFCPKISVLKEIPKWVCNLANRITNPTIQGRGGGQRKGTETP